jgi:predicted nucleic acid-binding protein
MGVVLDTSVFIDAERKHFTVADLALTTVSVAELEHRIWRAKEIEHEQKRRKFLEDLLAAVPAYPLTTEVARHAGRIDAACRKTGVVVGFQDLVIGATALEFGYSILTLNVRHFEMIPNLEVKHL